MLNVINIIRNSAIGPKFIKFKFWKSAYVPSGGGLNGSFIIKGNLRINENAVSVWAAGKTGAGDADWIGKLGFQSVRQKPDGFGWTYLITTISLIP
jgi:hypothetical protein